MNENPLDAAWDECRAMAQDLAKRLAEERLTIPFQLPENGGTLTCLALACSHLRKALDLLDKCKELRGL